MADDTSALPLARSDYGWDSHTIEIGDDIPIDALVQDAEEERDWVRAAFDGTVAFANYGVENPGGVSVLAAQGGVNAIFSTAGFILDAVTFLPRKGFHNLNNAFARTANLVTAASWDEGFGERFRREENSGFFAISEFLHGKTQFTSIEAVIVDPHTGEMRPNDYATIEKVYLYGAQGAVDVATFFCGASIASGVVNTARVLSSSVLRTGKMSLQTLDTMRRVCRVSDAIEYKGRAARGLEKASRMAAKASRKSGGTGSVVATSADDLIKHGGRVAKKARKADEFARHADNIASGIKGRTGTFDLLDKIAARRAGKTIADLRGGQIAQSDIAEYVATKITGEPAGIRALFARAGMKTDAQRLRDVRALIAKSPGDKALAAREGKLVEKVARRLGDVNELAVSRGLNPVSVDNALQLSRTTHEFGRLAASKRLFEGGLLGGGRLFDPLDDPIAAMVGMHRKFPGTDIAGGALTFAFGYSTDTRAREQELEAMRQSVAGFGGGSAILDSVDAVNRVVLSPDFNVEAAYRQMEEEQRARMEQEGGSGHLHVETDSRKLPQTNSPDLSSPPPGGYTP